MARLEQITEMLETGDTRLEDAIALYTEGLEIARFCVRKLSDVENKIKIITEKSGLFEEKDFAQGEENE